MALTLRTAGTVVTTAFFNDYYNLLTGVMTDQPVTLGDNLALIGQTSEASFTKAAPFGFSMSSSGGSLKHGTSYSYAYTFVSGYGTSAQGETTLTPTGVGTTTSSPTPDTYKGFFTIAVGPAGTTARNIYRTANGSSGTFYLCGTVADNTSVSFTDTMSDATLVTQKVAPTVDTFGGSLIIKDKSGVTQTTLSQDGSVLASGTVQGSLITTGYGSSNGLWVKDSGGVARLMACQLAADNDLHIMTLPSTNRIKFTKSAFAYDILVLDASGSSGVSTLSGSLTMSGQLSVTQGDLYIGSSGHTQRLIFNSGNNGGIDNVSGGWMDIYTGGTSGVRIWGGVTNIVGHTGAVESWQLDKDGTMHMYGPIILANGAGHGSLNAMEFDLVTAAIGSFTHNLGTTPIGAFVTGRDTSANNDYYVVTALSSTSITVAGKTGGKTYNVLLIA